MFSFVLVKIVKESRGKGSMRRKAVIKTNLLYNSWYHVMMKDRHTRRSCPFRGQEGVYFWSGRLHSRLASVSIIVKLCVHEIVGFFCHPVLLWKITASINSIIIKVVCAWRSRVFFVSQSYFEKSLHLLINWLDFYFSKSNDVIFIEKLSFYK